MSNLRNDVYELKAIELTDSGRTVWVSADDGTDQSGYYTYQGNPESNLAADIGSYCLDTTNADLYIKTTDTANTGWRLLPKLGGTSALTEGSILIVDANGDISELGPLAKGDVIVGDGSGAPTLLTVGSNDDVLTADSGEASGVKWAASGGAVGITSWVEETTTSRSLLVNQGVIGNNAGTITMTLPATAALGDIIRITQKGAGAIAIAQNAGQTIHFGSSDTTTGAGGSCTSTADNDTIELVCCTANTNFQVLSSQGSWTVV